MPSGAEFAWAAFWRLHGDRQYVATTVRAIEHGLGLATLLEARPMRIPFAAIDRYALRYRIEGSAFDLLLDLVQLLDREFLAWEAEERRNAAAGQ